ncbi:UNVERIFIED_CONTAM: hypothetical protein HHA_244130 [Hammondia hammondi]|eukprot:XP_008884287.1 hypothetical protein HHA_244130 [Hammondia hammondi]
MSPSSSHPCCFSPEPPVSPFGEAESSSVGSSPPLLVSPSHAPTLASSCSPSPRPLTPLAPSSSSSEPQKGSGARRRWGETEFLSGEERRGESRRNERGEELRLESRPGRWRGESEKRGVFAVLGFGDPAGEDSGEKPLSDQRGAVPTREGPPLKVEKEIACSRGDHETRESEFCLLGERRRAPLASEETKRARAQVKKRDCAEAGEKLNGDSEADENGDSVVAGGDRIECAAPTARRRREAKATEERDRERGKQQGDCRSSVEDTSLAPFTSFLLAAPSECLDCLFAFLDFSSFFSVFGTNAVAFSIFSSPSLLPQTWRRFALDRKLSFAAVPVSPSWLASPLFSADARPRLLQIETQRRQPHATQPASTVQQDPTEEPQKEEKGRTRLPSLTLPCCLSRGDFLRLGQTNRRWRLGFFSREQRISVFSPEPLEKAQVVACPPLFSSGELAFSASPPFPPLSLLPASLVHELSATRRGSAAALAATLRTRRNPSSEALCPLLTVSSSRIYTVDLGPKKAAAGGATAGGKSQVCAAAGEVRLLALPASMPLLSPFPLLSGGGAIRFLHRAASSSSRGSSSSSSSAPQNEDRMAGQAADEEGDGAAGASRGLAITEKQRKKKNQARRPPHVAWVPCLEHPLRWQTPRQGRKREDGRRRETASLSSSPVLRPSPFLGFSSPYRAGSSSPFLGSSSPILGESSSPFLGESSSPFLGESSSPFLGEFSSPGLGPASPLLQPSSFSPQQDEEIRRREPRTAAGEKDIARGDGRLRNDGEAAAPAAPASASSLSSSAPSHLLCLTLQHIDLLPPASVREERQVDLADFNSERKTHESASCDSTSTHTLSSGPSSLSSLPSSVPSSSPSACSHSSSSSLLGEEGKSSVSCGEACRSEFEWQADEKDGACVAEKRKEIGGEKPRRDEETSGLSADGSSPGAKASEGLPPQPPPSTYRLHPVALCSLRRQPHASGPQVLHPHAIACCALRDEETLTIATSLVWKRNTSTPAQRFPTSSRQASFSPFVHASSSSSSSSSSFSGGSGLGGGRETGLAEASESRSAPHAHGRADNAGEKRESLPRGASVGFVLGSTSGLVSGPPPVSFVSVIAAGTSSGAIYATTPPPCLVQACTCSQDRPSASFESGHFPQTRSSHPSLSRNPSSSSSSSSPFERRQREAALFAAAEASRGSPLQFVGCISSVAVPSSSCGPADFLHVVAGTPWSCPVLPSLPPPSSSPASSPPSPLLVPAAVPPSLSPLTTAPVSPCSTPPLWPSKTPETLAWHLRNWREAASPGSGQAPPQDETRDALGSASGTLAVALWLFAGASKGGGVKIFRWSWECSRGRDSEGDVEQGEEAVARKQRTEDAGERRADKCRRCTYTGKWECMYNMAGQFDLLTVDLQWGVFALSTPVDSKILFLSFRKLLSHTQVSFSSPGLENTPSASPGSSSSPRLHPSSSSSFSSSFCGGAAVASSAQASASAPPHCSSTSLWSSASAAFETARVVPPGGFPARARPGFATSPLMCPTAGSVGKIFVASPPTCLVALGGGRWAAAVGRSLRLLQVHYEEEKGETNGRPARGGAAGERAERRRRAGSASERRGAEDSSFSAGSPSSPQGAPPSLRCSSLCVLSGHDARIYRLAFDGCRRVVSVDLSEVLIVWDTLRQRKLLGVDLKVKHAPLTASHLASLSALLPRPAAHSTRTESPARGPAGLTGADCAALSLAAQQAKKLPAGAFFGDASAGGLASSASGTLAVVAAACAASEGRVMGLARTGPKPRRLAPHKGQGAKKKLFCGEEADDQLSIAQSAARLLAKEHVTQRCRKVKRKLEWWTGGVNACRDGEVAGQLAGKCGAETDSEFEEEEEEEEEKEEEEIFLRSAGGDSTWGDSALMEALRLQMECDLLNRGRRREDEDENSCGLASDGSAETRVRGAAPRSLHTGTRSSLSASPHLTHRGRDCLLAAKRRLPSTQSSWMPEAHSSPASPFQPPSHARGSPTLKETARAFSPPACSDSYSAHFPPLALPPLAPPCGPSLSREKTQPEEEEEKKTKEKKKTLEAREPSTAQEGEGLATPGGGHGGSESGVREPVSPLSLHLSSRFPRDVPQSEAERAPENRAPSPATGVGKSEETQQPGEKRKKTFAEAAALAKGEGDFCRRVSPAVSAGQAAVNSAHAVASELFCQMLERDSAEVLKAAAVALGMSVDELYVQQMMELQRLEEKKKLQAVESRSAPNEEESVCSGGNAEKQRQAEGGEEREEDEEEAKRHEEKTNIAKKEKWLQKTSLTAEVRRNDTSTSVNRPPSSSSSSSSSSSGAAAGVPGEAESPSAVAECLLSTLNGLAGVPRLSGLLGRKGLVWRQGPNSQARHIAAVCVGERHLALLYRELKMWQVWHFDDLAADESAAGNAEPGDL